VSAPGGADFHQQIISNYGAFAIFGGVDLVNEKILRDYQP
jgi:hypothetical protein